MLAEHPDIYAIPGETEFLFSKFSRLSSLLFYFQLARHRKKRWAEKTPRHIYKISDVLELNSGAKIICMLRDGRDVAVSLKARRGEFDSGCIRWVQDNKAFLRHKDSKNVLAVKYENLVKEPEMELREICRFLEIEFNATMMKTDKTAKQWYSEDNQKPDNAYGKNHNNYRNWQINQPLFDGSGRWEAEMTTSEKMKFDAIAGEMMVNLGYY